MTITKLLANVVTMLTIAFNVSAQDYNHDYNLLCNFRNGTKALIKLPPREINTGTNALSNILFNDESVSIIAYRGYSDEMTYEYSYNQLDRENPLSLVDPSVTSLSEISIDEPDIIITHESNGVMVISGVSNDADTAVKVYDVTGRFVSAKIENDDKGIRVDLTANPSGIYLINVLNVTIKALKK